MDKIKKILGEKYVVVLSVFFYISVVLVAISSYIVIDKIKIFILITVLLGYLINAIYIIFKLIFWSSKRNKDI
ncbi:hypothetical protein BHF71_08690 [Vulcanibacillus modesticaldus]|uniref:Uncharacterized protein n=1 Tax=Vulcanibacillus modesticaldus TaxID=337097 RepID=A0A1D2YV23_9BACI|nr:hypothetical protein BHF71_08690 [Vulcanibacillus modesticaldus]